MTPDYPNPYFHALLFLLMCLMLAAGYFMLIGVASAEPLPNPCALSTVSCTPQKIDILKQVCKEKGMGDTCAKHLLAMHLVETSGNCKAVGAVGEQGCFQLRLKFHKVTLKCAQDLACSARYTLEHLIDDGYKDGFITFSIGSWNGGNHPNRAYARKVITKARTL